MYIVIFALIHTFIDVRGDRYMCGNCFLPHCSTCASVTRPLPNTLGNVKARWCQRCVTLHDEYEPSSALLMLEGLVTPPDHDYLRSVRVVIEVTPQEVEGDNNGVGSDQVFEVTMLWDHDDEHAAKRESTSAVPTTAQRAELRRFRHATPRTWSDFKFVNAHLSRLLPVVACPLSSATVTEKLAKWVRSGNSAARKAAAEQEAHELTVFCKYIFNHALIARQFSSTQAADGRRVRVVSSMCECTAVPITVSQRRARCQYLQPTTRFNNVAFCD